MSDEKTNPEVARLLATGDYVEAIIACNECQGGITALINKNVYTEFTGECVFCSSSSIVITKMS